MPFIVRIIAAQESGDSRWMPLLGSCLVAFGCIRYARMKRSQVQYVTASTMRCLCAKGKQAAKRHVVSEACPLHLPCGWHRAVALRFTKLSAAKQQRCELCFDETKVAAENNAQKFLPRLFSYCVGQSSAQCSGRVLLGQLFQLRGRSAKPLVPQLVNSRHSRVRSCVPDLSDVQVRLFLDDGSHVGCCVAASGLGLRRCCVVADGWSLQPGPRLGSASSRLSKTSPEWLLLTRVPC